MTCLDRTDVVGGGQRVSNQVGQGGDGQNAAVFDSPVGQDGDGHLVADVHERDPARDRPPYRAVPAKR